MSDFDISKQPTQSGMGTPAGSGGAYGQKAALDRLKAAIPTSQGQGRPSAGGPGGPPTGPPPGPPPPTTQGGGPTPPPGSAVPGAILTPTGQPNTPVNTPLAPPTQNPVQTAQTPKQARLALLLALADSPNEEVAEWARMVSAALARSRA